ncbi:unnamed protein product [Rotaria sordida]|uniref:Uncharacterized protein n=1 Tax=Rotaria sordida TaxID=392033 RepID=A0A813Q3J6_9BILA|nr:unnamed protein product [Rotaria sordida]CAF3534801.1 unnamed protein product [Rotaria sordida]
MGCGASTKRNQQASPQKSPTLSGKSTPKSRKQSVLERLPQSINASPRSSSNQNRRSSTHRQSEHRQSEHDQASLEHRRLSNQTNNSDELERHENPTPNDELNNNTIGNRDHHSSSSSSSSPTDNPINGTKLHSRTQSLHTDSPQANDIHRKDSRSVSKLSRNLDGKISVTSLQHTGICQYCPHCQKVKNGKIPPIPELPWIKKNPGVGEFVIKMDNYDTDAIRKKLISEYGHLPGCYDYQPYLTIEPTNDNDDGKENDYYTQPFVARKNSIISPLHTPFPQYDILQRQEQRLNKPHEPTLFVD